MTADEVLAAVRKRHPGIEDGVPAWIFVPELRVSTGYPPGGELSMVRGKRVWRYPPKQRLDAWAMHTWPSRRYERVAYEIKVSRSDWLRELADPEKRQVAMGLSNRFYFAVPQGMVRVVEVPEGCGLVSIIEGRGARVVVEAPWRDVEPPSLQFVAALARRLAEGETR